MGFTRVGIQVDRLPQARTRAAPDRRPALALAVLGDQAVRHRRSVQRVLDLGLLERARGDPSPSVQAAWLSALFRPSAFQGV